MNPLGYPLWVVPLTPNARHTRPRLAIAFMSDGFGNHEWLLDDGNTIDMSNASTHLDEDEAKLAWGERRKAVLTETQKVEVKA